MEIYMSYQTDRHDADIRKSRLEAFWRRTGVKNRYAMIEDTHGDDEEVRILVYRLQTGDPGYTQED